MIFSKRGESDGEPSPEDDNLDDDELDVLSGEYVQIDGETGEVDSTVIKSILEENQIHDTQITQYEDPFSPITSRTIQNSRDTVITPIKTESSIVHSIKNDFNTLLNQDLNQFTLLDLESEYHEITI